ncbi:MAG: hypothetical protein JST26_04000 [Bacteroidetes bacterium]|nr:hypothetical protein [Bacteroidota bacterium]
MSTKELKRLLISKIDDTQDVTLLEAIYTLLNSTSQKDPFHVSEEQQDSIYRAKKDIDLGNYILNEDLNEEVTKWLNK